MSLNVASSASRSLSASIFAITGSVRNDIETVRSCWFWLLLACTLIVAIGVIIEEATEHLSAKGGKWIIEPAWHHTLARIGWTLVILGVIGEGLFEAAASSADSLLQEFNNTLLAMATDQAGNAAHSAKIAREELGILQAKADALNKQLVMGQAEMMALTKTTGEAKASAVRAAGAASDALTHATEVDKYADLIAFKVSWRMLDGKKFHDLMQGKPTGTAEIWFEPDDEAFNFAGQIARALREAGWKLTDPQPMPTDRKWSRTSPMSVLEDMRLSATMNGLAIGSNHLPDIEGNTAAGAFARALGWSMGRASSWIGSEYPILPDKEVIIAVGRHVAFVPPNPYIPKATKP